MGGVDSRKQGDARSPRSNIIDIIIALMSRYAPEGEEERKQREWRELEGREERSG